MPSFSVTIAGDVTKPFPSVAGVRTVVHCAAWTQVDAAEEQEFAATARAFAQHTGRRIHSLYGTSETLKIDTEGRVILSDALKAHAAAPHMAAYGAKVKELIEKRVVHILSPT